jgi:tetratricopeptide (TPR) repeat protein
MEYLMRLTPIALTAAIILATVAGAGHGQKPDDQIDPRSVAITAQAQSLTAQGRYQEATDLLETALILDPRNRQAFIALGRAAQGEKLPGKAVKFYLEALKLEPNDLNALAGQGEAFVQRGAVERAKKNLERIRTICKGPCPQADSLAAAIAKGPPVDVITAQRPVVGAPPKN